MTGSTGSATTPFGYGGQLSEHETGLGYLRAREYEPGSGQFLTVDPQTSQTLQPYAYAQDDPVNQADPTGLCAAPVAVAAATQVGGPCGNERRQKTDVLNIRIKRTRAGINAQGQRYVKYELVVQANLTFRADSEYTSIRAVATRPNGPPEVYFNNTTMKLGRNSVKPYYAHTTVTVQPGALIVFEAHWTPTSPIPVGPNEELTGEQYFGGCYAR